MYRLIIHGGAGAGSVEHYKMMGERLGIDDMVGMYEEKLRKYTEEGVEMLKNGVDSLDVVEKIINRLEDDEFFNAGKGSVRDSTGKYTHDACIVDGNTKAFGAVTQAKNIKNPITMARTMMYQKSVFNGDNKAITKIAKNNGVKVVKNSYFKSKSRDMMSKTYTDTGTVGVVALDLGGKISAGTSTGGLDGKIRGRVADSCIIGVSTVAESGFSGLSTTGKGEAIMKSIVASDVLHRMKYLGSDLRKAMDDTLAGVGDNCGIIGVSHTGDVYFGCNTPRMYVGWYDGDTIQTHVLS